MTRIGLLSIAVIFSLISTILTQQDLKCWSCNNINRFCDDPFDSSKLNAAEKLSLITCSNGRCVKTIANIPGGQPSLSVNRFCADNQTVADQHCKNDAFTSCESCATDECNGAAQYGPIALLVAIPVAIAKIFLF